MSNAPRPAATGPMQGRLPLRTTRSERPSRPAPGNTARRPGGTAMSSKATATRARGDLGKKAGLPSAGGWESSLLGWEPSGQSSSGGKVKAPLASAALAQLARHRTWEQMDVGSSPGMDTFCSRPF